MTNGTRALSLTILLLAAVQIFGQSADQKSSPIVAGKGWGNVAVGARRSEIERVLGKGKNLSKFADVYFLDFEEKGVQVSFTKSDDRAHAIFFYNGQRRDENFRAFDGITDKGITWKSSEEDVLAAYGTPKSDFGGPEPHGTWRRLVFDGIDFRFENHKMVRIGIPGN